MSDTATWSPSRDDIARAQRKATEVLQAVATPDAVFDASQALLDESDRHAGYRAYFKSLLTSADADATSAAKDAFAAALAESAQRHAERAAAAQAASFGADDDCEDDEDDSLI